MSGFKRFFVYWKQVARFAGDFQSRLILTVAYYTVILPFGLLLRLMCDPLRIKRFPKTTAFVAREKSSTTLAEARDQF